jgi:hypothetical protein
VTKSSHRKENGQYEVVTEISSNFKDFKTYLDIYNTLVEKLDKTVRLQPPEFFHTPARIDALKYYILLHQKLSKYILNY